MAAPAYINHQGAVAVEVDHAFRPEVVRFSRTKATPTRVKKTGAAVTKTVGTPDVTGSLTVVIPAAGFGGMLELTDFTISYPWGGKKYLIQHCSWNSDGRDATPGEGDSEQTLSFTGTAEIDI